MVDPPHPDAAGGHVRALLPEVHAALLRLTSTTRRAAREAGLDLLLLELVQVRCSRIHGCHTCEDVHVGVARTRGASAERLAALDAWEGSTLFSPTERAALEVTDAVVGPLPTGADRHQHTAAALQRAAEHLTETQRAALVGVLSAISAFNRYTVADAGATP